MKGFLQRMAANAVRPQDGIHPLVGSIYAGPTTREPRKVTETRVVDEERLVTSLQPPPDEIDNHSLDRSASPDVRVNGENIQGVDARQAEGSHQQSRPVSFRPLMGDGDVPSARRSSYVTVADTERPDRSGAIFDREGSESLRTPDLKSGPVLPGVSLSPSAMRSAYRAMSDVTRRSAPVEREAGKVEIHIGRIEVTAVPPESPRPAATRPRKSLDLGEYLKRRDGRTG